MKKNNCKLDSILQNYVEKMKNLKEKLKQVHVAASEGIEVSIKGKRDCTQISSSQEKCL